MPESYQRGMIHPAVEGKIPKLADFEAHSQFIKIACTWCMITHWYYPGDLRELFGNVMLRGLENRFRCEKCLKKEYMTADVSSPSGKERAEMTVKRLSGIKIIRRPVWTDVKL